MSDAIYFLGMRLEYWTLFLAVVAILFVALKDFILPYFLKPKLKIDYRSKEPYKRAPIVINSSSATIGAFDRFKIENIGRDTAKGCRCQIYSIKDHKGKEMDLQGFPIRWASRPDSAGDFTKAERLNIGPGESEFADLLYMRSDDTTKIFFSSYHNVPVGMADNVPIGDHVIEFIISGNNFRPYIARFKVFGELPKGFGGLRGFKIKLLGVKQK